MMRLKAKLIIVASCLIAPIGLLNAQQTFDPKVYDQYAELIETLPGPLGWKAHIVETGATRRGRVVLWQNEESGVVTFGKMFDANGRDLNKLLTEARGLNKTKVLINIPIGQGYDEKIVRDDSAPKGLYNVYAAVTELDANHYTIDSSSDNDREPVYVFYDYLCSICAQSHKDVKGVDGRPVKWLPVSILNENSSIYGAGVLEGVTSIEGISRNPTEPLPNVDKQSVARVIDNTILLESIGTDEVVTPTVVYKTASGSIEVLQGRGRNNEFKRIVSGG